MNTSQSHSSGPGWKIAVAALIVIALLTTAGVSYLGKLNGPVVVNVPTPKMPKPNAHYYFVAAGKAIVDRKSIIAATTTSFGARKTREMSWAEKEKLVRRNEKAFKLLREGFHYPYYNPPMRTMTILFPEYSRIRDVCRLLSVDGQIAARRGDYSHAMDSYLDACQAGSMMPKGAPLINMLVGAACEGIGRTRAWEMLDKVDSETARRGTRRVESILRNHVPFADTLTEEKYSLTSGLAELLNRPNWRPSLASLFAGTGSSPPLSILAMRLKLLTMNRRKIVADCELYLDQCVALSRKPYSQRKPWPSLPDDMMIGVLLPVFEKADFRAESNRAADGLLCLSFALRAYMLEHGKYPPDLNALIPGYVSALPVDPFATSGTFRYHLKPGGYVLYSIGPDGKDDGGRPGDPSSPDSSASIRARRIMDAGSTGDIVAGVNKM